MHTGTDVISGEKNEALFVMIVVLMPADGAGRNEK